MTSDYDPFSEDTLARCTTIPLSFTAYFARSLYDYITLGVRGTELEKQFSGDFTFSGWTTRHFRAVDRTFRKDCLRYLEENASDEGFVRQAEIQLFPEGGPASETEPSPEKEKSCQRHEELAPFGDDEPARETREEPAPPGGDEPALETRKELAPEGRKEPAPNNVVRAPTPLRAIPPARDSEKDKTAVTAIAVTAIAVIAVIATPDGTTAPIGTEQPVRKPRVEKMLSFPSALLSILQAWRLEGAAHRTMAYDERAEDHIISMESNSLFRTNESSWCVAWYGTGTAEPCHLSPTWPPAKPSFNFVGSALAAGPGLPAKIKSGFDDMDCAMHPTTFHAEADGKAVLPTASVGCRLVSSVAGLPSQFYTLEFLQSDPHCRYGLAPEAALESVDGGKWSIRGLIAMVAMSNSSQCH
ncbi:hypothetical protein PG985_013044 [Apiospora marii]|uniref:uncharacterized protein n=1 Tax=Apiospora marii TaxID=335849 RepID=UPI00313265B8